MLQKKLFCRQPAQGGHAVSLQGQALGGSGRLRVNLVDSGKAAVVVHRDGHVGIAVVAEGHAEGRNHVRRGHAVGQHGQGLVAALEDGQLVAGSGGAGHVVCAFAVHLEEEVVLGDVPAAEHGVLVAQGFQVDIIGFVKRGLAGLDADYARGELALHLVQRMRRAVHLVRHLLLGLGGAAIARGEDVEVAVVCRPDGLVVLRTHTATGKTNLVGLGNDGRLVEAVAVIDGNESLVRILGGGDLSRSICAAAAAAVVVGHQLGVGDLVGIGDDAIVAHAHRHHGRIELAVGLLEAGEADNLAIAQEVLGHAAAGRRVARRGIEVVELEVFGVAAFVLLLVAVVGRGGDDVLAPRAVGGGAVVGVAACLVGIARLRIEGVGEAGALCTVVVLEVEEVLLAIIDPVGAALRLQAITHSGQRAAVQVVGGHKVGAAVVATGLGGDDVAAHRLRAGFIRIAGFVAGRYGIVTVTASSHQATGQKGCGQSPCELFFLHMRIIINGL